MDDMLKRIAECIGPKHGAKKELADHLGIHPNVITNWFNGRNKSYRRHLPEIAAYYKVSEEYLKGEDSSAQKETPPALTKKDEREKKNVVRTIGRDGSYEERYLTDEQLEALKAVMRQMPKVEDDF